MKNLFKMIMIFFLFPASIYGQVLDKKIYIIDTITSNGNILNVFKNPGDAYDPRPFRLNIFIPNYDSLKFNDKKEVKRYIYNINNIFFIMPSDFFFMVKNEKNSIDKSYRNLNDHILDSTIIKVNYFHFRFKNLNASIYKLTSRFIVILIDVNLFKKYYENKLNILKQKEGYIKVVVPIS